LTSKLVVMVVVGVKDGIGTIDTIRIGQPFNFRNRK